MVKDETELAEDQKKINAKQTELNGIMIDKESAKKLQALLVRVQADGKFDHQPDMEFVWARRAYLTNDQLEAVKKAKALMDGKPVKASEDADEKPKKKEKK